MLFSIEFWPTDNYSLDNLKIETVIPKIKINNLTDLKEIRNSTLRGKKTWYKSYNENKYDS